jgi:hypothetical protein
MLIAHIAGVPVEEFLPAGASVGTVWVLARSWVHERARRRGARRR